LVGESRGGETGRWGEGEREIKRESERRRSSKRPLPFLPRLCLLFDVRRERQRRRAGERRREREKDRGR